jgi:hypothetical protein
MKTVKIFPYSESELLRTATRFSKKLSEHLQKIEDHDPDLNEQFMQQFKAALELSITHPQNKSFDERVIKLHDEIGKLILEIKKHVMNIKFYFQKAFPHDPEIWEQYGYCEFEQTSQNYFKLDNCIDHLLEMVKKREDELRRNKFHFETIAEVEKLKKNIKDKHDEIIDYCEENDAEDEERVAKLNNLYHLMQIIDASVRKYRITHHGALKALILP